ncbi:hypothetical protein LINGRAHAP2_LOCUS4957, partial [Linum grandiflorum]
LHLFFFLLLHHHRRHPTLHPSQAEKQSAHDAAATAELWPPSLFDPVDSTSLAQHPSTNPTPTPTFEIGRGEEVDKDEAQLLLAEE